MSRKVRPGALIGLFVVVCIAVGVLVWPTPKDAMAYDLVVVLNLNWGDIPGYNNGVTVELLDNQHNSFDPPRLIPMMPNGAYTIWLGTHANAESENCFARFNWNENDLDWHNQVPAFDVAVNWSGNTVGASELD